MFKFTNKEMSSILSHAEGIAKELKILNYDSLTDYQETMCYEEKPFLKILEKAGCEISEDSKKKLKDFLEYIDWVLEPAYITYMENLSDKLEFICSTKSVELLPKDYSYDILKEKLDSGIGASGFLIENKENPDVWKVIQMILESRR